MQELVRFKIKYQHKAQLPQVSRVSHASAHDVTICSCSCCIVAVASWISLHNTDITHTADLNYGAKPMIK